MDQQSNINQNHPTPTYIATTALHQENVSNFNGFHVKKERNNQTERDQGSLSEEELKIRSELETDIERKLEEEIKDGIYQLALKLHRIYQQRKEREALESSKKLDSKALTEVNISIKMDGETRIEIKESKKEANDEKGSRPRTPKLDNLDRMLVSGTKKKFDWANSLRAERSGPEVSNKRNERSKNQAKVLEQGWKW